MVPEKLRAGSLQPGTSALPLLKSSLLISQVRVIPLLSYNETCIGYVTVSNIEHFRKSRHFSYTKVDKVRVLKLKSKNTEALLEQFAEELKRKGLLNREEEEEQKVTIFAGCGTISMGRIACSISRIIGAKVSRVAVIGYTGHARLCQLWMAKRSASVINNSAKYQLLLSCEIDRLVSCREEIAETAYKTIGLQPDLYAKLQSSGLTLFTSTDESGRVYRTSTHCYDLDLSGHSSFNPKKGTIAH